MPPPPPPQPFTPTCGNGIVEPGEECDDDSPCCMPDACRLVPNAKCSQGPLWAEDDWSRMNGTSVGADRFGEGWTGQCCSEECQFLSSATLCQVREDETLMRIRFSWRYARKCSVKSKRSLEKGYIYTLSCAFHTRLTSN